MAKRKKPAPKKQVVGFLGVGLDNKDGEQRLTRCESFVLIGGSHETHERMQGTAIKFIEVLRERGKRLENTDAEEVIEIFHEASE